jgi:hypothetical protein
MPGNKEKVGFIFECGRGGPDYQVCAYFLGQLSPTIEIVPRFLDNKPRLLNECGSVASALFTAERCNRVVVTWDLEPAWGGRACRHNDKERALASLTDAEVPLRNVLLMCVERELECWLMADTRALQTVIGRFKHPHRVGQLINYRRPDQEIGRPKTVLISLFQRELGRGRKYIDRDHAILLARSIPDWSRVRRSNSFRRFVEKAARANLP